MNDDDITGLYLFWAGFILVAAISLGIVIYENYQYDIFNPKFSKGDTVQFKGKTAMILSVACRQKKALGMCAYKIKFKWYQVMLGRWVLEKDLIKHEEFGAIKKLLRLRK